MVPMRDGVKLYTQIFTMNNAPEKLPFLVIRTPYGIGNMDGERLKAALPELCAEGFIVVQQDIRGRFKSEGKFVMLRTPRDPKDKNAIDESTDAYDTIEWLLKHVPNNNGRAGMAGTSYGGWLTVMGMLDPHPALKAAVPAASPADMWIGDDFHHNGAFRLSYGFEYSYMMESSKEVTPVSTITDKFDAYDWYLGLGALSNYNKKLVHDKLPTWNDFVEHPNYDDFWKRQAFAPYLNRVTVPTLNVAGWWDQEDFYGPLKIYELLEKHDTNHQNFLVVGPWNHGGWGRGDGNKLGRIEFGSATAKYYRETVLTPFLTYHLKGKGTIDLPEALTFRTGTNEWLRHDVWPPKNTERKLYMREGGKLSFDAPGAKEEFDSYISDPANPVPYRPRPIDFSSGWTTWLVEDQRFVDHRPDVVTWVTDPLTEDLTISGKVSAHLFASTSGTDSDWIVKVIDVYPEKREANAPTDPKMAGFELMVAGDVLRGRYRNGLDKPEAVAPNAVNQYQMSFPGNDHTFKKGHRVMVQVQSTWFPVIDRNPQKYVANIFNATDADFQTATQRVYRSQKHPSYVALPVEVK
jgi:putative CocE/NonD family hydrolase